MIPRSLPRTEKTEYNWPIPEDYWPSAATASLPPRSAHSLIKFQTIPCAPVTDKFPFDKYELEPSPLTQYILERRQPTMAWPVCYIFIQIEIKIIYFFYVRFLFKVHLDSVQLNLVHHLVILKLVQI
jgi:hypothetical protein